MIYLRYSSTAKIIIIVAKYYRFEVSSLLLKYYPKRQHFSYARIQACVKPRKILYASVSRDREHCATKSRWTLTEWFNYDKPDFIPQNIASIEGSSKQEVIPYIIPNNSQQ